jgi:hypothetical protein
VVEDASEIAAIDPCATGLAPDEIVGFVRGRASNALPDDRAARYRSIFLKVVRHFRLGDFGRITGRTGFAGAATVASTVAKKLSIGVVLANEAAIVAASAFAHLNASGRGCPVTRS